MSGNLFEDRNWLLPQNYLASEGKNKNGTNVTSPRPPVKEEEQKTNEQSLEKCGWGPDCPFCKGQEKGKEEDGTQQKLKAFPQSNLQKPQSRQPKTLSLNDKYPNKTRAKQQWEEEMERLNEKYKLDCFSSQMKESNTVMNMVMKHLSERCKSEFIKIKCAMTPFLKSNLPTISLSNM